MPLWTLLLTGGEVPFTVSDRTVVFHGVSIPRYAPTSSESRAFKNCKRYINHQHQGDPYVCCNRKGTGRRCYQALHS